MKEVPQCIILHRTTQIAQEKGLIDNDQVIHCQFDAQCIGTECFLSSEEQTFFFSVMQTQVNEVPTGFNRFMQRLAATAQIIKLDTVINS